MCLINGCSTPLMGTAVLINLPEIGRTLSSIYAYCNMYRLDDERSLLMASNAKLPSQRIMQDGDCSCSCSAVYI